MRGFRLWPLHIPRWWSIWEVAALAVLCLLLGGLCIFIFDRHPAQHPPAQYVRIISPASDSAIQPTDVPVTMTPVPLPTTDGVFFEAIGKEERLTDLRVILFIRKEGEAFAFTLSGHPTGCRQDSHCKTSFRLIFDEKEGKLGELTNGLVSAEPFVYRFASFPSGLHGKVPGWGSNIRLLLTEYHLDDSSQWYYGQTYVYHLRVQKIQ